MPEEMFLMMKASIQQILLRKAYRRYQMKKKDAVERLYDLLINPYLSGKDYDAIWVMLNLSDAIDKIRAEIEGYKSTIDNAISEDELKIEGMKEAYADCLEIVDKYKTGMGTNEH